MFSQWSSDLPHPPAPRLHWSLLMSAIAWGTREVYLQKLSRTLYWWYLFICPILVTSRFQKPTQCCQPPHLIFAFCLALLFSEILLFHRRKPSLKVCQIKREKTERILTLPSYPSSIILWKVVLSSYPHCGLFHENLNCYNICFCVCEKMWFDRYNSLYWFNYASYR